MEAKDLEVIVKSERLNPKGDNLILEIKDGKIKYYDIDCKEIKEADITDKEAAVFAYVAEQVRFFDISDEPIGINLNIHEGYLDTPINDWITIKAGDKKKTVCALFCGVATPGAYNAMVWQAIKLGQAKAGHSFFG